MSEQPESTEYELPATNYVKTYRKLPIEIQAIRWNGVEETWKEICDFVPMECRRKQGVTLELYNTEELQWITCPLNHWVMQGVRGEFYPCSDEVFQTTYEEV